MPCEAKYCIAAGPSKNVFIFVDNLDKSKAEDLMDKIYRVYPDTYWRIEKALRKDEDQ